MLQPAPGDDDVPADPSLLQGRSVLRLASVFEVAASGRAGLAGPAAHFDPIGGMQNHTAALTRCLDDLGVAQTVVTSRLGADRSRTPFGRRGRVVRVGVHLRRLRQLWALAAVPVVLSPGHRVDLVHAHQGEDLGTLLLGRLAAWRHRAPLVVTVHLSVRHTLAGRSPRTLLLRRLGGALEAAVLRRAAAVLVLVGRTAALLAADGVPADRVHVVPSGVEPDLFVAPAGCEPDPFPEAARPRIGYVGRLAPQKRPELAVAAFAAVREPASLVVVGDGPSAPLVDAAVQGSPARARISRTGFVPHDQVPAVLRALDVLVLPAAYEEMGSVLVEAMAVGLPVVASRVGGIPEVVRDGETGLLVPPGDVPALAAALDRLVGDPELRARLSACAREAAAAYAWPTLARRVAAVYAAALGAHLPDPAGLAPAPTP